MCDKALSRDYVLNGYAQCVCVWNIILIILESGCAPLYIHDNRLRNIIALLLISEHSLGFCFKKRNEAGKIFYRYR